MHYRLLNKLTIDSGDCLVIGISNNKKLPEVVMPFDETHNGLLSRLSNKLEQAGDILWQRDINGTSVLLIHCGDEEKFTYTRLKKRLSEMSSELIKHRIDNATIILPLLPNAKANEQLQQMILVIYHEFYQMLHFKSCEKRPHSLKNLNIYLPSASQDCLDFCTAMVQGMQLTRDLANLPANICTPTYLADQARELANDFNTITTKIMDRQVIKDMGMGAFMSVAQGSIEPPQFIELHYQGKTDTQPIVLIGKGITFDSGGISIKPSAGMEEMKYDMAGAASVLGTLKACALLKLPIHVIGLIPATENMPSGSATKPGDIVTSLSGQTIEIVNTDAEGRLILADALTYAERFTPQFVIDMATLTGAVIVALGYEATGLLTNDDKLADSILQAAQMSGDTAWRLPLLEPYQDLICTPLADIANSTGDKGAGTITAACFLSRFAKNYRWAHLDIAGTAWISGKKRQATGRPVPLLLELLKKASCES